MTRGNCIKEKKEKKIFTEIFSFKKNYLMIFKREFSSLEVAIVENNLKLLNKYYLKKIVYKYGRNFKSPTRL